MGGFSQFLRRRGYAYETTMMYLGSARHLSNWMATRGMPLERMDENTVRAFDRHLSHCRCPRCRRGRWSNAQSGVRRLLDYLRAEGLVRQRPAPPAPPALLVEFSAWMKAHRGIGEGTLTNYGRYLGRFLRFAGEEPTRFDARVLRNFVLDAQAARKATFVALRMFVRFLVATGRCPSGLEEAIPRLAEWRLASLPRYLPSTDVERVVASAPFGSRERAVLLLLARLGLRRGDIVALSLQDIDWKQGLVRVVGKSGREAHLPLPQDVGNALLAYLRRRPASESDRVFLTAHGPLEPVSPAAVSGIAYWAIRRAGIRSPSRGCHLLRHSAATRWLREGLSMQDIGVLLRHRHLETTEIYAKVDVRGLRKLVRPWPRRSP